jgi:hypothetical protein
MLAMFRITFAETSFKKSEIVEYVLFRTKQVESLEQKQKTGTKFRTKQVQSLEQKQVQSLEQNGRQNKH